jgi:hypothetical protein
MPTTAITATEAAATVVVGKGFCWGLGVSVGCSEGDEVGVGRLDGDEVGLIVVEGDEEGEGDQ